MSPADFNYSHTRNPNLNGQRWLLRHAVFWALVSGMLLAPVFAWEPKPLVTREVLPPAEYVNAVLRGGAVLKARGLKPVLSVVQDTHSMEPVIYGGDVALGWVARPDERYQVGMLVIYDRGDAPNVLHEVEAVSGDGKSVFMAGIHNDRSDGWFPVSKVKYIIGRVVACKK
jgi:hypothetical protein